jgi:pimeloyl-ACP methyl ester carboxylesterase
MHIIFASPTNYTSFDIFVITQVILVAHDFGGACISHAMEMFPSKVAKAVFLCATMLANGHSALDMFQQVDLYDSLTVIKNMMKSLNFYIMFKLVYLSRILPDARQFYSICCRWIQMVCSKRRRNLYTPMARTGLPPLSTSTRL